MEINKRLDAKGLACPMPVVQVKKAIDQLESQQVLEVEVTDKGALADIPAWANSGGHTIINQSEQEEVIIFTIQKK